MLQPGGQDVSSPHTQSVADPASISTQPSIPDADQPEGEEPPVKKKGPKNIFVISVVL